MPSSDYLKRDCEPAPPFAAQLRASGHAPWTSVWAEITVRRARVRRLGRLRRRRPARTARDPEPWHLHVVHFEERSGPRGGKRALIRRPYRQPEPSPAWCRRRAAMAPRAPASPAAGARPCPRLVGVFGRRDVRLAAHHAHAVETPRLGTVGAEKRRNVLEPVWSGLAAPCTRKPRRIGVCSPHRHDSTHPQKPPNGKRPAGRRPRAHSGQGRPHLEHLDRHPVAVSADVALDVGSQRAEQRVAIAAVPPRPKAACAVGITDDHAAVPPPPPARVPLDVHLIGGCAVARTAGSMQGCAPLRVAGAAPPRPGAEYGKNWRNGQPRRAGGCQTEQRWHGNGGALE
jgi:hypothetical protein